MSRDTLYTGRMLRDTLCPAMPKDTLFPGMHLAEGAKAKQAEGTTLRVPVSPGND